MLEELVDNLFISSYAYRHFEQLVEAYNKEYPCSNFSMTYKCRSVVEVTTDNSIGRFVYTPSDELYFHSSRVVGLDVNESTDYFRASKLHRWIQEFMRCFKHKHIASCVTKRTTYSHRTMCIIEELYRIYWVRHYDKSQETSGLLKNIS